MNQLILGDCLEVMKNMDSESIDLIYLAPPFFSNRNYEVIWGNKGEIRSFEDRWSEVSTIILLGLKKEWWKCIVCSNLLAQFISIAIGMPTLILEYSSLIKSFWEIILGMKLFGIIVKK